MLETLETLKSWAQWGSLTLLGGFCLAVSAVIGWKLLERHGRILLQLRWASRVVAVALVVVCVMRGATKETNSPPAGLMGPPMGMVAQGGFGETDNLPTNGWREVSRSTNVLPASTFAMPSHGREWEEALARGARRGYWRVANDGWSFSNANLGWTNGFMWAEGQFRPRVESKLDGVQVFDHHLALAPSANWARYGLDASMCWCATNSVGGLIGTYVGAAIDDDPAKIVNAQFELFPSNGMLALRYDLSRAGEGPFMVGPLENGTNYLSAISSNISEVVFQRVHPDDWDMDGLPNGIDDDPRVARTNAGWNQSAEWAARSFPSNATEIAAAGGYLAWATARGAQPNRHLIGLEISSPSNIWPICLTFGDKQVMCNGKEEILFAIDDGARYAFSLSAGALASVTTHSPAVGHSSCLVWEYPGDSWAYDLLVHLDSPSSGWVGKVAEVMVDDSELTHFYPNDSKRITAVVTNCHEHAYIGCEWHHGGGIIFSDPHSLSTDLTWEGDEVWATNYVELVTRYEGGYSITNTTAFTVGMQLEPNTEFSVSCQKVFFLNDGDFLSNQGSTTNRPERIRPVTLNLRGARSSGGYVTLTSTGDAAAVLCKVDDNGVTNRIEATTHIPLSIPNDSISREFVCTVLASCPKLGRGSISATFIQEDSTNSCVQCDYQVIEPIRRLVTNTSAGNFGYRSMLNPTRLVYGTNAVLCVGVNVAQGDSFALTNIQWTVKQPGTKLDTIVRDDLMMSAVVVGAAETSGDVEVIAKFNDDEIQPKFILPIVQPRVIPIRAFLVEPPEGEESEMWSEEEITGHVKYANMIFGQVGIVFELQEDITTVPNSSDKWVLGMIGDQAEQLFRHYSRNDCVEVYFLGHIKDDLFRNSAAFRGEGGIAISKTACHVTLAHELGHALGLQDCYVSALMGHGLLMANWNAPMASTSFTSKNRDWGMESGRGFYASTDSVSNTICRLLMSGIPHASLGLGKDMPDGKVVAMGVGAESAEDAKPIRVGAQNIEPDDRKVFSK